MSDTLRPTGSDNTQLARPLRVPIKRRSFFMYAGATAGATALVLAGCNDDDDKNQPAAPTTVNVGITAANDVGVLNYAYALEQLEAAFYTQVKDGAYYQGLPAASAEKQILDDLQYHEIAHREFFKAALGGAAIRGLEPDFSTVDFGVRNGAAAGKLGVLEAAKAFEDLGVAAYNGAGKFIQTPLNLLLAGKIVSVEARHAALIRDLLLEASFVGDDVVQVSTGGPIVAGGPVSATPTGLERSKSPADVVQIVNTFLKEGSKLDVSGLV
ncbi:ferritin-like domain-containing protein [Hymenobacter sp.]|uniref:ferritin-like domain-containing protein n=1 Tax=Hymenobacter sp. TaxID=1898978 RepID=UPI00286C2068|nr:ferritin-like domain-containing protein [Hymenobacter sp.]